MAFSAISKEEAARIQLEQALKLQNDGGHPVAVITLAGAAEEILGQLVRERGWKNSLDSLKDAAVAIHKHATGESVAGKEFVERANRAKNSLKHHTPGENRDIVCDFEEEAVDILDRAITNYWAVTHNSSAAMNEFVKHQERKGRII